MSGPLPVVVLVSGRGSNLRAIDARIAAGELPARILAVLSDREDAAALSWAAERGLATGAVPQRQYADRAAFDAALGNVIAGYAPALVVLAGFMRVLGSGFFDAFPGRVLNVHPALLPAFPGSHAVRDALAWGVKVTGVTVHLVDEEVDHGPIVLQEAIEIRDDDDWDSLELRVHALEHRLLPAAVRALLQGRMVVEGRAVRITGEEP